MRREDLVKWLDTIEELMTKTAFRKDISVEERALWWAAKPLYEAIQKLLRRKYE